MRNSPAQLVGDNRRHHPRSVVELVARAKNRSSARFVVKVHNISVSGLSAEAEGLEIGDVIWLTIPGFLSLEASVTRRQDRIIGCAFATPISAPALAFVLDRSL